MRTAPHWIGRRFFARKTGNSWAADAPRRDTVRPARAQRNRGDSDASSAPGYEAWKIPESLETIGVLLDLRTRRRTCRRGSRGLHETEHRLLQLRIHFVGDGHHVEQHGAKIHRSKIVL